MAGYDMKPLKWAKAIPSITFSQIESDKRKEISAEKSRRNNKIFDMGQEWHIKGKSLSEAHDVIDFEGKTLTDEEFKVFKNGFMYIPRTYAFSYGKKGRKLDTFSEEWLMDKEFMDSYALGYGFKLGYDGVTVDKLPQEFVQNKNFLVGYKNGIEAKEKEFENKNKESKKRR